MSEQLLKDLEAYKKKNLFTYYHIGFLLGIPSTYISRWKKKNRITGVYARLVRDLIDNDKN